MDERTDRAVRIGLAGLLDPVRGFHPDWASSPAAQRAVAPRTDRTALRHWLLVAAAAITVLSVGAALIIGGALRLLDPPAWWVDTERPRESRGLVVTELGTVAPEHSAILELVRDGDGQHVWALSAWGTNRTPETHALIRLDPATGRSTAWELDSTHADIASALTPARQGGVWLTGPDGLTLRRFGTTGQVGAVAVPKNVGSMEVGSILDVAEATDGALWLATATGVFREVDGAWVPAIGPGLPVTSSDHFLAATRIAIGGDGSVWAALATIDQACPPEGTIDCGWVSPLGIGRWDGSAWTFFDGDDAAPLAQPIQAIEIGPDGSVWVSNGITHIRVNDNQERWALELGGVARFDGLAWLAWDQSSLGMAAPFDVSITPDGAVFALGTATPQGADAGIGEASVVRFDGRAWTPLADGLPDSALGVSMEPVATVAALGRDLAYAGTARGLYRLAEDHWEADASSVGPPGATLIEQTPPGEHWVVAGDGIWTLRSGRWLRLVDAAAVRGPIRAAAVGPDGAIWTVGHGGVARLADGGMTILDDRAASGVVLSDDGRAWVYGGEIPGIDVYGPSPGGVGWEPVDRMATPFGVVADLTITKDGEVWIAGDATTGGAPGCVARLQGGDWSIADPRLQGGDSSIADPVGSRSPCHGRSLAVGPDSSVWLTFLVTDRPGLGRYARDDWTVYGLEDGLPGGTVAVGGDGTVWAAGGDGLFRLSGKWWIEFGLGSFDDVRVDADGNVWAHSFGAMWQVRAP